MCFTYRFPFLLLSTFFVVLFWNNSSPLLHFDHTPLIVIFDFLFYSFHTPFHLSCLILLSLYSFLLFLLLDLCLLCIEGLYPSRSIITVNTLFAPKPRSKIFSSISNLYFNIERFTFQRTHWCWLYWADWHWEDLGTNTSRARYGTKRPVHT